MKNKSINHNTFKIQSDDSATHNIFKMHSDNSNFIFTILKYITAGKNWFDYLIYQWFQDKNNKRKYNSRLKI